LRNQIHEDLLRYEFFQHEVDEKDTISLEEFLKSLIICINPGKHKSYLKRIEKISAMMEKDGLNDRITLE
jgi:hypothetical protein